MTQKQLIEGMIKGWRTDFAYVKNLKTGKPESIKRYIVEYDQDGLIFMVDTELEAYKAITEYKGGRTEISWNEMFQKFCVVVWKNENASPAKEEPAAVEPVEEKKSATFKVGETYKTRSACDHNCIFEFEISKRSKCFISGADKHGKPFRCKVKHDEHGNEFAMPCGVYSMAPVISSAA